MPVVLAGRPAAATARSRGWRRATTRGCAAPVEHLVELGHERIAFFGGRADFEHVQVRRGALARGAGRGRAAAPGRSRTPATIRARRRVALLRRASRPRSSARATRSRWRSSSPRASAGSACPTTSRWSGFDDSPLAALATPALTSVRVDYAEFGAAAAGALLAAIGGEPAPAYSPSPPELVVRASTARRRRR